jgi:hypothetical protein
MKRVLEHRQGAGAEGGAGREEEEMDNGFANSNG